MSMEKTTPLAPGTRIKTYKPNPDKRKEWTDLAWHSRMWGVLGTIVRHHDSNGLCYDVQHDDGTRAYYDPSEFDTLPKLATEVLPQKPRNLKRMTINKELSCLIRDRDLGFIVVFESVRQVELVVDGATGRPFSTKDQAHQVAQKLANDLEAIEAHVVQVESSGGYMAWA